MQQINMELAVGDSIQVGNRILTVIDIDGPEISFRVDELVDDVNWPTLEGDDEDFRPSK